MRSHRKDILVEPLPAYSPDFMPVEHLWQWLRSDITYHACYERQSDLIEQVSAFQQRINACPNTVADRSVGYNLSQTRWGKTTGLNLDEV